jgi:hypothetical protein
MEAVRLGMLTPSSNTVISIAKSPSRNIRPLWGPRS